MGCDCCKIASPKDYAKCKVANGTIKGYYLAPCGMDFGAESYDQDDGWDDEMVMDFVRESINDAGWEVPETRAQQIRMFLGLEEK